MASDSGPKVQHLHRDSHPVRESNSLAGSGVDAAGPPEKEIEDAAYSSSGFAKLSRDLYGQNAGISRSHENPLCSESSQETHISRNSRLQKDSQPQSSKDCRPWQLDCTSAQRRLLGLPQVPKHLVVIHVATGRRSSGIRSDVHTSSQDRKLALRGHGSPANQGLLRQGGIPAASLELPLGFLNLTVSRSSLNKVSGGREKYRERLQIRCDLRLEPSPPGRFPATQVPLTLPFSIPRFVRPLDLKWSQCLKLGESLWFHLKGGKSAARNRMSDRRSPCGQKGKRGEVGKFSSAGVSETSSAVFWCGGAEGAGDRLVPSTRCLAHLSSSNLRWKQIPGLLQTHCTNFRAFPGAPLPTVCTSRADVADLSQAPGPVWSGSEFLLKADCDNDRHLVFAAGCEETPRRTGACSPPSVGSCGNRPEQRESPSAARQEWRGKLHGILSQLHTPLAGMWMPESASFTDKTRQQLPSFSLSAASSSSQALLSSLFTRFASLTWLHSESEQSSPGGPTPHCRAAPTLSFFPWACPSPSSHPPLAIPKDEEHHILDEVASNLACTYTRVENEAAPNSMPWLQSASMMSPSSSPNAAAEPSPPTLPSASPPPSPPIPDDEQQDLLNAAAALVVEIASRGPAFMGNVYALMDSGHESLLGIRQEYPGRLGERDTWHRKLQRLPSYVIQPICAAVCNTSLVVHLPEHLVAWIADKAKEVEDRAPIFNFFIDENDAERFRRRLLMGLPFLRPSSASIANSVVGKLPLESAYEYFRLKERVFQFVPNKHQLHLAKLILQMAAHRPGKPEGEVEGKGDDAGATGTAKRGAVEATEAAVASAVPSALEGVPIFSCAQLAVAMLSPDGTLKWYTPYFFNKGELDSLIQSSLDNYFRSLAATRRRQRHAAARAGQQSSGFPGSGAAAGPRGSIGADETSTTEDEDAFGSLPDPSEFTDESSFQDPPEVQEFVSELGTSAIDALGGSPPVPLVVRDAELAMQDGLDHVLLGTRWGRILSGLQPAFPPHEVDSFEARAAEAEEALKEEAAIVMKGIRTLASTTSSSTGLGPGPSSKIGLGHSSDGGRGKGTAESQGRGMETGSSAGVSAAASADAERGDAAANQPAQPSDGDSSKAGESGLVTTGASKSEAMSRGSVTGGSPSPSGVTGNLSTQQPTTHANGHSRQDDESTEIRGSGSAPGVPSGSSPMLDSVSGSSSSGAGKGGFGPAAQRRGGHLVISGASGARSFRAALQAQQRARAVSGLAVMLALEAFLDALKPEVDASLEGPGLLEDASAISGTASVLEPAQKLTSSGSKNGQVQETEGRGKWLNEPGQGGPPGQVMASSSSSVGSAEGKAAGNAASGGPLASGVRVLLDAAEKRRKQAAGWMDSFLHRIGSSASQVGPPESEGNLPKDSAFKGVEGGGDGKPGHLTKQNIVANAGNEAGPGLPKDALDNIDSQVPRSKDQNQSQNPVRQHGESAEEHELRILDELRARRKARAMRRQQAERGTLPKLTLVGVQMAAPESEAELRTSLFSLAQTLQKELHRAEATGANMMPACPLFVTDLGRKGESLWSFGFSPPGPSN